MSTIATGTPRPGPFHRLVAWLTAKHNSSLVFLLGLSLGLGLVAAQINQLWLLIVFSVVWAVTIVAFVAQFIGRREHAHPHAHPRTHAA
ncbi:hypothetical protein Kpho02_32530 [Kitasatospora phosalacinea]|uniref:Uncharacterized protein n=1 Tax=Kitasatospora phosalacinea TaxID=2065 RepID=A0A9W6V0L0_9ACTN|nr:hypothetical protein [Kitasatospora phosalacinea]GLW70954.1 hypothetical protein Kpho02_32530 [Kitasatospora phosalacinea]